GTRDFGNARPSGPRQDAKVSLVGPPFLRRGAAERGGVVGRPFLVPASSPSFVVEHPVPLPPSSRRGAYPAEAARQASLPRPCERRASIGERRPRWPALPRWPSAPSRPANAAAPSTARSSASSIQTGGRAP